MYISQDVSERIKLLVRQKGLVLKDVLKSCDLNVNSLNKKTENGLYSFSLAKIADYLDCSVDYLLCRTENPNAHKTHASDVVVDSYDEQLANIIDIYKQLDRVGKARLLVAADELLKGNK